MKHWFLPETPDVLGTLAQQASTTVIGLGAFAAWSAGDLTQATVVRRTEHEADDQRRALQAQLRSAFSVPLDAEDIYELSERLDAVLNGAKNALREADVMGEAPDQHLAGMAADILDGVRHLQAALSALTRDDDAALREADLAISGQRKVERSYRAAMSEAMALTDVRALFGRRELYRRYARIADQVVLVAERIWYAVVKQG